MHGKSNNNALQNGGNPLDKDGFSQRMELDMLVNSTNDQ